MKLNRLIPHLSVCLSSFYFVTAAQAGIPLWSFKPDSNFPPVTSVGSSGTTTVQYLVSNNSSKVHNLVIMPQAGVSQTAPCLVGPKGSGNSSCVLTLSINGSVLPPSGLSGGPYLCQANPNGTPNPNQCYQPSPGAGLAVTLAPPLQLGQLINGVSVTCPTGSANGAICKHYTITGCHAPNGGFMPDVGVTIATTTVASPKGTIILQAGGGGTGIFSTAGIGGTTFDFPDYYLSQGYNVVQTKYDPGSDGNGWQADDNGVLAEACRPATVFAALYNNPSTHPSNTAFCGQGISGGGGTFAYSMAHYANSIPGHERETQSYLFDYTQIVSGPAVNRLDVGCAPAQVYNNENIVNCGVTNYAHSSLGTPVYSFPPYPGNPVDKWESTTSCGTPNPPQSAINVWARDGVISTGPLGHAGVFNYGSTNVSFYFCGVPNNNQSLGLGWFLTQKIMPLNQTNQGLAPVNCFTSCTGEAVWANPNAVTQTLADMAQYCVHNAHA